MPEYYPALRFGVGGVDWQERIDFERMRRARAERMQSVLRKHGIPALLATGTSTLRYLTGLKGPEYAPALWYVLFFAEEDPVVFGHAGYITQQPQECPWIKEWRLARAWLNGICGAEASAEEARRFAEGIGAELRRRGLHREPLAVVGFDGTAQGALRDAGIEIKPGWPLMLEATAVKTEDEIRCIQLAVAIAERAWTRIWEVLKPGVTEDELIRAGLEAAYAGGAEFAKVGIRSGPFTFERGMRDSSRVIQFGELLYVNLCGTSYMGYRTCLYRTFVVGRRPTPKEEGWYQRLVDRLDRVIEAIRPGGTTADAARHFAPASTWGYEDEAEVLTIEIGHGVGINQYEVPVINRQWSLRYPQVFEPGMVMAVEGREGAPGQGGVRLEDMVVVTPRGAQVLDRFPRDRILSAAVW